MEGIPRAITTSSSTLLTLRAGSRRHLQHLVGRQDGGAEVEGVLEHPTIGLLLRGLN